MMGFYACLSVCLSVLTKNNMCFYQFQIFDNIAEKGGAGGLKGAPCQRQGAFFKFGVLI